MLSMSTLSAGQAENYYDKDDLYHAQEGQTLEGGRMAETMRFDPETGTINEEHLTKDEYRDMIKDNERFRQIEFNLKLSPEFRESLKADPEKRAEFNQAAELAIKNEAQRAGIKLNENSFGYNRDGIITGAKSHNIATQNAPEAFKRLNMARITNGPELADFRPIGDSKAFQATANQTRGRIGVDMTFSAPKSVSLMRHASPEHKALIDSAHREALGNVLKHINQEYAQARVQVDGKPQMIKGDLDTYIFNHEQSRRNDPEYHSHVNISNRIKCADGQTRSIEPKAIFQDQKFLGQLYRMELDRELKARGLETVITDKKQYFFEVKGVPETDIKEASSRRQEIEAEWKKQGLEPGDKAAKEQAALSTRGSKKDFELSAIAEKWSPRMEALKIGIGAPIRAENLNHDQVVREIEKTRYHFTEKEFLKEYKQIEPAARIDEIKAEFSRRLDSGEIFTAEKDGQKFYATRGTLENEARIKETVSDGFQRSWNLGKKDFEGVDLVNLTNGQRNAIHDTMTTRNQFHAIEGDAGSGKTYMLDSMRQVCEKNGIEIKGMAPSNDAVEGMRKESGIKAETIHKFLGNLEYESFKAQGRTPEKVEGIKQDWDFSAVQKATKKEIWVVDESSMLDNRIARQITTAAQARGAKVVLIGDPKQLQAVGPGNAYTNLIRDKYLDCTRMKEVMRQKDTWHVYGKDKLSPDQIAGLRQEAKAANAVLKVHGGTAKLDTIQKCEPLNVKSAPGQMVYVDSRLRQAVDKLASGQSVKGSLELLQDSTKEITNKSARLKKMSADFLKTYNTQKINSVCLVATNSDRKNLNYKIREDLKKAGVLGDGVKVDVTNQKGKAEKIELSPGDRVMSLGKHQPTGAENGSRFIVRGVSPDGQKITLEREGYKGLKTVDLKEFNRFTHAYAVTAHKAQGMSIDHVYANLDTTQKNFSYRNNLYVNLSRAKESAHVYTNDQAGAAQAFEREKLNLSSKDFERFKLDATEAPDFSKFERKEIKLDPTEINTEIEKAFSDLKIDQSQKIDIAQDLTPKGFKLGM
jgi:conjugative relaxase-like TrwC/TraI family protein